MTANRSYSAHDPDYRTSLQDFTTFLENLSEKVVEADDTIPELPVKDIVSLECYFLTMIHADYLDISHLSR